MKLSVVLIASTALVSSAFAAPVVHDYAKRGAYNPHITTPNSQTVWHAGDKFNVTWDASDMPRGAAPTGKLMLGYMPKNGSGGENLHWTLAENFPMKDGRVEVTLPADLKARTDYTVVLMGNSGNKSPGFAITAKSKLAGHNPAIETKLVKDNTIKPKAKAKKINDSKAAAANSTGSKPPAAQWMNGTEVAQAKAKMINDSKAAAANSTGSKLPYQHNPAIEAKLLRDDAAKMAATGPPYVLDPAREAETIKHDQQEAALSKFPYHHNPAIENKLMHDDASKQAAANSANPAASPYTLSPDQAAHDARKDKLIYEKLQAQAAAGTNH